MASMDPEVALRQRLQEIFPNLVSAPFKITSPATPIYNCIAWAAGDDTSFWWPGNFWPRDVPAFSTRIAFAKAFATKGYTACETADLEEGVEKICVYEKMGRPEHAARQLPDGWWTSKLGSLCDISHTLNGLAGVKYGRPSVFFKRPRVDFP